MRKIISVTAFSALLTLIKMGAGFIVAKLVSIYTGPAGLAMLGQLQSFSSSITGIAISPASNGVVRYTSENLHAGIDSCSPWWRAATRWVLILAAVLCPLLIVFCKPIASHLLYNSAMWYPIVIIALMLPISVAGTFLTSIINGMQNYKKFIAIGMCSVTLSTSVMSFMVVNYGMRGALVAVSLQNGLIGFFILASCLKTNWLKVKNFFGKVETPQFKGISKYMVMAFTTAVCMPVALIFVRKVIIKYSGWDAAGEWQSVWKISETYLAVITISLSTYYLPKLSALKNIKELKVEVVNTAVIVLPIISLMAVSVYFLRDFLLITLYTAEFSSARNLFAVQLLGDVIKIACWILSYPMIARGDAKWFIATEITYAVIFSCLSLLFVGEFGVQGANIAYLISYIIYAILVVVYFMKITK